EDVSVELERDIITNYGSVLRPDRLNINDKSIIITDYKTGTPQIEHKDQVENYAAALRDMGYVIDKILLVYITKSQVSVNNV
ncbi:MAG: hypothetical protein HKM28_06720, partial [Flavobacteriaceae bacterium]|nr:hypothetical protein [Flavobacteriaceae bacterium]